jgi:UDP-N-acetylglucosamine:LPS N-acetylglucosamine transferase
MIGYYVHHHGRGHLTRAMSICAHLPHPVTVLSSLALSEFPGVDTVRLPRDDSATVVHDPSANGSLHWAPLHDNGLRERMLAITEWVAAARPDVMVVDVSVEVAMLVRLLGIPVVVIAMPGDRTDAAHELVYRAAEHIVAAWPRQLYEPHWLRKHSAKTSYVGGISRFDGRVPTVATSDHRPTVLVLDGAGGSKIDMTTVLRCAAEVPDFQWSTLGVAGGPWVDDPWPALCSADVVVSSAGQNSVADIAAAGRPAVIVAAERPFAEQRATADALERGGLAVATQAWPRAQEWPSLIEKASSLAPEAWTHWQTRGAAARAAAQIQRVGSGRSAGVRT